MSSEHLNNLAKMGLLKPESPKDLFAVWNDQKRGL
jgi:hypothetical protein